MKDRENEYKEIYENIAFVVSHKITSPLATMHGLLKLMHLNLLQKEELSQAIIYLEKCVNDLETNCRELGELVYKDTTARRMR